MKQVALYSWAGLAAASALIVGVFIYCGRDGSGAAHAAAPAGGNAAIPPPAGGREEVAVVRPTVEDLHRSTTQPAHIEPFERTDVYAKAAGYVAEVLVDIGDRVERGQVLARLSIPEMDQEKLQQASLVEEASAGVEQARARLSAAAAEVTAAEANLAVAQATIAEHEAEVAFRRGEHARITQLVASQSMNEAVLEEKLNRLRSAESALAVARAGVTSAQAGIDVRRSHQARAAADLARAQAQVKVAEANLAHVEILAGYLQIVAPYDGMVTRRWVDSGDFVTSAANSMTEPLFTIDRDVPLRIVFDVPESQSSQIRIDQPASLVVDALKGRTFTGRVRRTTGILDPKTRTLRAEVELDAPTPFLRPGMYGMITVVLAESPHAMTVPTTSLQYEGELSYVLCAVSGVCQQRPVDIGYSDANVTEILSGIEPGDLVVAETEQALRPGDPLRVARTP
jgi:RND family efflux transporter MFP subunit